MRFEEALGESFRLWRENLEICLPFLFVLPLASVAGLYFIAAFLPTFLPTLSLSHQLLPTLAALLLSFCAFVFAEAGVVRMAADLVSAGRTELGRALVPPQIFLRLLGFRLLLTAIALGAIGLVQLPLLALLRPFAVEEAPASEFAKLVEQLQAKLQAMVAPLVAIVILVPLVSLFLLLLAYFTLLVPYAIVASGMGLIEGLKHGVGLIWRHKLRSSFTFAILLLINGLWQGFLPTLLPAVGGSLDVEESLSELILYLTSPAYVISVAIWSIGLAFVMGFGTVLLAKLYFELERGETIPSELHRAIGLQKFRRL